MDDISIISIPDSDISFHTLIDGTTSTEFDNLTHNQQLLICSLFVNHWVDGTLKKGKDLRSAKKDYVQGLKQNTLVDMSSCINTKLSNENWKENLSSISSKSMEPSRSPLTSNKSDDSRKRKGSDCCIDLVNKKRDENHNNLVGITERRKSLLFNKPVLSTATIARRKTILIDPRIHTQKFNQQNATAVTKRSGHNLFSNENIKTNRRASSSFNDGTEKSGGIRLTSSPSNLTVTKQTTGENKSKDYSSRSHKRSSKGDSSYRQARPSSSSYRPASSSYRDKSYRPEYSSKRPSSSESSSNPREHKSKKRRPSEDRHQSHSAKKSRLSSDQSKSEMKHHSSNTSPLKNYKIPKYGGYSKQPTSNIQNSRPSKSPSKVEINTLPSTSKENPSTDSYERSEKDKSSKPSSTSETHQQQKKVSTYATASLPNTPESEKTQNIDGEKGLPDVPELDDCIIPETNPTMTTNRIKFNPLNRHATVEKNNIASGNDNWIIRNEDGKIRLIKEKEEYNRKSTVEKQLSATQINDEIATNEITTVEVATNEVPMVEVATNEVPTVEVATNEVPTVEVATNEVPTVEISYNKVVANEVYSNEVSTAEVSTAEVATIEKANKKIANKKIANKKIANNKIAKNKIANNEVIFNEVVNKPIFKRATQINSSQEIEIQEDKNELTKDNNSLIRIDSSQQSEVSTSNFGGQKNDDEKDELLKEQKQCISIFKQAVHKYECNIKEREQQNSSHEKTLIEQQNVIKEREQIIQERDRMIREREQKIKDYEERLMMQDRRIHDTMIELTRLNQSNTCLVAMLNDKEKNCKEHHKEKPKPRKPRTIRQTISPSEIVQPPIVPATNGILHISPQQTLAGNSSHFAGNSLPISQKSPSILHQTYCSTPTSAHLLTNSATQPTISTATKPNSSGEITSIPVNVIQANPVRLLQQKSELRQQRTLQQSLDQGLVFQPSNNQQPVFYCLKCRKPANLICEKCRNYCACSQSCYELISAKHKSECILPNMVFISSL